MVTEVGIHAGTRQFSFGVTRTDWTTSFLILLYSVYHAIYNARLPLHPDEAYYWLWSRHLDLSYYDHPPLIAYLIKLFTLFKTSECTVRLAAVFCMGIATLYTYLLAKRIFDDKTALYAVLMLLSLPATNMGFTIVTPDAPLMLFWAVSMYYTYLALTEESIRYHVLAGISMGLLLLSKYTSVLFLGSLFLFLLFNMPKKLLDLKAWFAVAIAVIIFLPVIWWNYQHDWLSFAFQYHHGTSDAFRLRFDTFLAFLGGQFVVLGILFFPLLVWGAYRYRLFRENFGEFYVFCFFLFPTAFFLYKSLFKKMSLNWGAVAVISGMVICAHLIVRLNLKRIFLSGLALSVLMTLLMQFPELFFLPPKFNMLNRLYGPKEAVEKLQQYIKPDDTLFADHLRRASMLSFYTKGHPRVLIPTPSRKSEFTIWDKGIAFNKLKGIYLSKRPNSKELERIFGNVRLLKREVIRQKGFKKKTFYVYRVAPVE
jgi:4-amino-4-deoxy-L-arabinose transferase-like glycosyltransferase